jgi:oxygen-dependent protoporphyrinogen oxidase
VFSARGGLSNLVNALYENAGKENFSFNKNNLQVVPEKEGYKVSWQTHGEKREINVQKVVFTGGSFALADVFPFIEKEKLEKITRLRYARIVEVTLGFKNWKGIELDGFGGLIPSKEKRDILGVLYMSTLFENRAPEGGALLTIFMGGIRNENLANQPDDKIKEVVKREITDLMQLPEFQPDLFKITRYDYAIPQYEVNSGERFETIAELEKQHAGLILGGNMRNGIGMADRAKQGKMLAEQVKNSGL